MNGGFERDQPMSHRRFETVSIVPINRTNSFQSSHLGMHQTTITAYVGE